MPAFSDADDAPKSNENEAEDFVIETSRVPDAPDEVIQDDYLPADLEADFAPLRDEDDEEDSVKEIDPYQYDSLQAQIAFDAALEAFNVGEKEKAIQDLIRASKIAETAREWYLAALACQRVGDYLLGQRHANEIERGFRMYRRAVVAYEESGLFAESRELAYKQMCIRLRRSHQLNLPWRHRVELFLQWAIAGFGYRPFRVIGTILCLIFAYGWAYWKTQGIRSLQSEGPIGFWQAVYFSGVTFGTIGYGDYLPKPSLRMAALSEGLIGAFMIGLFVVVLAKRMNRM
jgi:hypothetical protein